MRNTTIRYFKKFLHERGADVIFESLYKDYRFPANPETADEYLSSVKSPFVIVGAFDFNRLARDSRFDMTYWNKMHMQWNSVIAQWRSGDMATAESLVEENLEQLEDQMMERYKTPKDEKQKWFDEFLTPLNTSISSLNVTLADDELRFTLESGRMVFSPAITRELKKIKDPQMSMFVNKEDGTIYLRFASDGSHAVQTKYSRDMYAVQSRSFVEILLKYFNLDRSQCSRMFIKTGGIMWHPSDNVCVIPVKRNYAIK